MTELDAGRSFSGWLLRLGKARDADVATLLRLGTGPVRLAAAYPGGWNRALWTTLEPQRDEPRVLGVEYQYEFLARSLDVGLVLVGHNSVLVSRLLNALGYDRLLEYPRVLVHDLAVSLIRKPHDQYAAGGIHAQVNGFGRSLKSIQLYGDDLAGASLVSSLLPRLVVSRLTLRETSSAREVLSLGSRGELHFRLKDVGAFAVIDECLAFLEWLHVFRWDLSR